MRIWVNVEDFSSRRVHLKKAPLPTGLDPRLARAMINLASAKSSVLDPFCGSGGILEEANLLDLEYFGVDISKRALEKAKINLGSDKNLFLADGFSWDKNVECVVSDLPYGKSSSLDCELVVFVERFFSHFSNLTEKIVICTPSNINIKDILEKHHLKALYSFNIYVHRSLTRQINVIRKK